MTETASLRERMAPPTFELPRLSDLVPRLNPL